MDVTKTSLLPTAKDWFNLSLFNTRRAGEYFEYLVQGIDPMWSLTDCKARVIDVRNETADTKTWVLRPTAAWKGFKAGQHVHITAEINGANQTRTFTISSTPFEWQEQGFITLTVKRVPDGRFTGWMHDHLEAGAIVTLSQAQGEFTLPQNPESTIVYFAAGSGITPIASQLRTLSALQMPVATTLLYFSRTEQDFIFGNVLKSIANANPRCTVHTVAGDGGDPDRQYAVPQGFVSAAHIDAALQTQPELVYICGPYPFREGVKQLLAEKGFNPNNIREEAFGLPPAVRVEGAPVTVKFSNSRSEASSNAPGTLLEMAEEAGLTPTSGCRMGICYTCKCTKKSGQVRNVITGELSSNDEEEIQICVSTPVSDVEIAL